MAARQQLIHVCFDWRWPLVIFREEDRMNRDLFGKCLEIVVLITNFSEHLS